MKKKIFISFVLGAIISLIVAGAIIYCLIDTGATVVIKNKTGEISVIDVNDYEAYDNCLVTWVDKSAWYKH